MESTYETCLEFELKRNDFSVARQTVLPIIYDGIKLDSGYRIDLLVENEIIIELKSVEELTDVHKAQLITYLKLADKKIGYLMNFNVVSLKQGIIRLVI